MAGLQVELTLEVLHSAAQDVARRDLQSDMATRLTETQMLIGSWGLRVGVVSSYVDLARFL